MTTPNIGLPELSQSQSSKEITHNLALRMMDVLIPVALVQTRQLVAPPVMVAGNLYIVAPNATVAWVGQDNKFAFTDGASWYFIAPKNKWPAYIIDEGVNYRFNGTTWQVDIPTQTAVNLGNITGNVTIDLSKGNFFYGTLTGNITLAIINPPPTGKISNFTLEFTQDSTGNRTVTFPSSFKFPSGTLPNLTLTKNAVDALSIYTRDGGNTYKANVVGLNFA